MKNKEGKNIQDRARRNEHSHKDNVYGNMIELDKEPTLARSIEIDEASTTMDDCISDDVYANVDELNKEAELKISKEKEKTPKTMKVSTSKTTKAQLILAALVFLFIVFLFLIVLTSLLLKYYLALNEKMSHLKNHEYVLLKDGLSELKNRNLALNEEMSHLKNHEYVLLKDGLSELKNRTDNQQRKVLEDMKTLKHDLEMVCKTCPPGWKKIGLFCYYFSTDELPWDNARDECVKKGSAFVFLQNMEETEALISSLRNGRYWIGLRRDTEPGKWKWVDGSMLSYSHWQKGEPNNLPNENCAESLNGYWNDLICTNKLKYIYKKLGCW